MRVKVGHRAYRVVREKRDGLDGECDHTLCIIAIDPDLEGAAYRETLFHEAFHAWFNLWDITEPIHEERAATLFAHILLTLLHDNPHLLDELK